MLPLSQHQNDWNSTQEQCAKCKRSFRTSQLLNLDTHLCKEKQAIDPKVIDTKSTNVFPITNVAVE